MAKKRGKPSQSAQPSGPSKPIRPKSKRTGRYVICPGSGFAHPQLYVEVMDGPKCRFVVCPQRACGFKAFLRGEAWQGEEVGFSPEEVAKRNPDALIL